MKNRLKKFGIGAVVLFSLFGVAGAYNVLTFNPKTELENDLVEVQRLINKAKKNEDRYAPLLAEATKERAHQEARQVNKKCALAILKKGDGEDVSDVTKGLCPKVFPDFRPAQ